MGGFRCLTNGSYDLLKGLNRSKDKTITDNFYQELEDCVSYKHLIAVLTKNLQFSPPLREKVWLYIIDEVWSWKKCDRDNSTIFNQFQSAFFRELLNRGGIYPRDDCESILTSQQISEQIILLEDLQTILTLRTTRNARNKTLFIIHPKFLKKVIEHYGV